MITLYGSPASRAARCLWALEELALPYRQISVDGAVGSGRSEFLAINPTGKVPLLIDVRHHGVVGVAEGLGMHEGEMGDV